MSLGIEIKYKALLSILSLFHNKFNKSNNTGTQMLDSIIHGLKHQYLAIYMGEHFQDFEDDFPQKVILKMLN